LAHPSLRLRVYNDTRTDAGKELVKCGKDYQYVLQTFDILMGKAHILY
jgi:hypothetical protein